MSFYGELYLATTVPFEVPEDTRRESELLARLFEGVATPLLDLGCGPGRHTEGMRRAGIGAPILGLDFDRLALSACPPGMDRVHADAKCLPLATETLGGAYCWMSTLFTFEEPERRAIVREVWRCLRPDARFVVHVLEADYLARLGGGRILLDVPAGELAESWRFDRESQRWSARRDLHTTDGRVLTGRFTIHAQSRESIAAFLEEEGFPLVRFHSGAQEGRDLVVEVRRGQSG